MDALSQAGIEQGAQVVFADEMRLGLHGQIRRVWAPRGWKVLQRRQIRYEWSYLALGVDSVRGELRWRWLPSMRQDQIAPLVRSWRRSGVGCVVWDGAGSHRAGKVLRAGPRLVSLPPYSPELNPPERVFEEVRRKVEGRLWPDLASKRAAADAALAEIASDPERTSQLVGWEWIRQAYARLPKQESTA